MNSIKHFLNYPVLFLNRPFVKEGVKNISGGFTFLFGITQVYDILRYRQMTTESFENSPKWIQQAHKIRIFFAKISLLLSASVSKPGVWLISRIVGVILTQDQSLRFFGPNTQFAVYPWHPRHLVSFAAAILALPTVAYSAYKGFDWINKKIRNNEEDQKKEQESKVWITNTKLSFITLFNFFTSRPVLHIGNKVARIFLAR